MGRDGVGVGRNRLTATGERGCAAAVSADLVEGGGATAVEPVARPMERRDQAAA